MNNYKRHGQDSYLKFISLQIDNYGPLTGSNFVSFNQSETIICSGNGLGKTTIFKVLESLGEIDKTRAWENVKPFLNVRYEGSNFFFESYRYLTFITSELLCLPDFINILSSFINQLTDRELLLANATDLIGFDKSVSLEYFWNPISCGTGEIIARRMALVLAIRKTLNIEDRLPLVMDSLFNPLDIMWRQRIQSMLEKITGQKIFLIGENEVYGALENKTPDYYLSIDPSCVEDVDKVRNRNSKIIKNVKQ